MEFLYVVYPALFQAAIFPIEIIFAVLDRVGSLWPFPEMSLLQIPFMSVFFATGMFFCWYVISKILNKHFKDSWSRRNLFLIFLALSLIIELLKFFFSDYLIVEALQDGYFLVFYMSMVFLGIGAMFFFACKFILRKTQHQVLSENTNWQAGLISSLIFILGIYPFLALGLVMVEIFIDPVGNPQATRFAIIHAAIKNTCIYDENRENCPHSLEEISYIEPEAFQEMMQNTQVSYVYNPESNDYTLVVRYAPLRAVVFDQRLIEEKGLDFWEYDVSLLGNDKLKNPPEYPGPWKFEEWVY